jgi:hypothetical protein
VLLVPDSQVAWTALLEQLRLAASRNEALAIVVRSQRAVADPSVDVPAWVLDAFRQTGGWLPLQAVGWRAKRWRRASYHCWDNKTPIVCKCVVG